MSALMRRITPALLALPALLFLVATSPAADATWPREIKTDKGIFTVYQPQPEKLVGNLLSARAAASLLEPKETEPTFGVFWFTCRVDTDNDAETSTLRDIVVTQVRWPESTPEEEKKVADYLTNLWKDTVLPISLERLKASLATAELEAKSLEGLKHDPPRIVFVEELSVLLLYDGEPRGVDIPNTRLEHIANAPFAVIKDKTTGTCWLSGGKTWYSARDPKGPWTPGSTPPAEITKLVPPDTSKTPAPAMPPKIVVATEPTELIATDGKPNWKPIGKGELIYVANTETPVVREVTSDRVFVLISGRWFAAPGMDGPWAVVRPDELPAAFKDIPPESDLADARVSVAGTPEAADAMLDAQVPQTAAIDRSTAKFEAKYDGDPQFKGISGTKVEYATNTSSQVLRIDGRYYACDNAVWFVSNAATGPWAVADSIPSDEIKKIPPSEPVYNVTHVTVYESTPSVVYVGYTPGYMWSYPWYGVPIYGTGWHYPPYWGPGGYYPYHPTWGLHVGYNPWTGWSMGVSYSVGFMSVGFHFGGGYGGYYRPGYPPGGWYRPPGCYPPGGYHPPHYPPGHRPGYGGPGYGRPGYGGAGARPTPYGGRGGASASTLPAGGNLYNNASTRDRVAPSSKQRDASNLKADRVAKGPNNVYADKSGNVHRQTSNGWQSRENGQWNPSQSGAGAGAASRPSTGAQPSTRPAQPSTRPAQPSTRPAAPQNLDRDSRARAQGASRSSYGGSRGGSYGGSRGGGSYGGSRGGGGGRGGGGRR